MVPALIFTRRSPLLLLQILALMNLCTLPHYWKVPHQIDKGSIPTFHEMVGDYYRIAI